MVRKSLVLVFLWSLVCFSCRSKTEALIFLHSNETEIEFQWSGPSEPYLTELRDKYQLDSLVSDAATDIEKVQKVCDWVHHLWEHDGVNTPEKDGPISILDEAKTGKNFRCVEYSIVIQGCLCALSIPARVVVLMTRDVETVDKWGSHYVVEAFVREQGKWCMVDGQRNAIPVLDGVPLSAVEFQAALAEKQKGLAVLNLSDLSTPPYFRWIRPSLFYFQYYIDNRVGVQERSPEKIMLVPVGAKIPVVFQRKWPMENMSYTNSFLNIYDEPDI